MPRFLHELSQAKVLFETLANEMGIPPVLVEKDYWVMHCLWGLQRSGMKFEMKGDTSLSRGWNCIDRFSEDIDIRFETPGELNINGIKVKHVEARLSFFEALTSKIKIPGTRVSRNRAYDDSKAQNGGISLLYDSHFAAIPDLKPEILLEVGFTDTAPNEPRIFTSWAVERVRQTEVEVVDNRAMAVKCFNPEYTFVDKLQTICRKFRQHRDRKEPQADRPKRFLRHYYDLYKLLEVSRVKEFMGTTGYAAYKKKKIRGQDEVEFQSREAFTIEDAATYGIFEKEFASLNSLMLVPGPTFKEMLRRIREKSPMF